MTDSTDFPFDELEALIDKHGLVAVLRSIEAICFEKAEHVAVDWQNASLAKRWCAIAEATGRNAARAEMALLP